MGYRNDRNFFNTQMVEQICVGVRLFVKCSALAEGRAQISKARRRNPVILLTQHGPYKEFALIVAAAAPVDHQDSGA